MGRLLKAENYSLQANRKRFEGKQHPDRDGQFQHIAATVEAFQARDCPVISVDTKKKELVGNYLNRGKEWTPKGAPLEVEAYDFINADLGKAVPYGIYDLSHNLGWVSVGTDHDTTQFAVRSIRRWWEEMGGRLYPEAKEILIMGDGGGSNGSRNRLWKVSIYYNLAGTQNAGNIAVHGSLEGGVTWPLELQAVAGSVGLSVPVGTNLNIGRVKHEEA